MKFQLRPYRSLYPASSLLFGKEFDQEFESLFSESKKFYPLAMDVSEDEDSYSLHFDIPGLKKEEIQIELKDNYLVVKGERKIEKKNASTSERWAGEFLREVKLPTDIDLEKVVATFEDGVLSIKLAKLTKQSSRTISIK